MRRHTTALCIALALLAAACAGRQFVRPEADAFLLGKTTRAEIVKQYGAPDGEFTLVKNGQTVRGMGYRHITMFGRPNIYPERVLRFVFVDDALVGYDYSSSYVKDKTDFEEDRIYRMRKGETTKAQVIDQLGRPGGMYIYPMTGNATDTAIVYRYFRKSHEPFKGLRILDKIVVISFDRSDVISGLEVDDVMSGVEVGPGDSRIAGGKGMEVKPEPGTLTSGAPAIPPADTAIGRTPDASTAGPPATAVAPVLRSAPRSDAAPSILVGTWDGEILGEFHSGQPAAHPYRTLVISSAVEETGRSLIAALYGFKGTSLGPVQVRVSNGDPLRIQFLTQANSNIELQLVGNHQLSGSFTTSIANVTSSCRVRPCPIKFQRMNPPDRATLVRTWRGTANSRSGTYPFTISFRDDGTWHATSPTLQPGNFDGTWQSAGSNMMWTSITTGRSGMLTLQEGNGRRILRMIPEDGTSTVELMPVP